MMFGRYLTCNIIAGLVTNIDNSRYHYLESFKDYKIIILISNANLRKIRVVFQLCFDSIVYRP